MMISIHIVVLNWNRSGLTIDCLKSLAKLQVNNFRLNVIVVDNHSTDNSVEKINNYISKKKSIFFKMLTTSSNLGYAEGNNVGIRYALENNVDYVLVLNNDTLVDPTSMNRIIEAVQKDSKIGAVCPKIYFAKGYEFHKNRYRYNDLGKVIWAAGGIIDWANVYGTNRGVDEVDSGQFDEQIEVDFAPGTCVLYSTEALREIGLFDNNYFMYLEDMELSMRLKHAGYKILYQPDSVIWHKVAGSSKIGSDLNDYFITRNRMLFGMKYAPTRAKFALLRESVKFLIRGRKWQRIGVQDYFSGKLGKGSWR